MPNKVAIAITSSFLGMAVEEINVDVEDAIGELVNMLGGNCLLYKIGLVENIAVGRMVSMQYQRQEWMFAISVFEV